MFNLARIPSDFYDMDFPSTFELLRPKRGDVAHVSGSKSAINSWMLSMDMHEDEHNFEAIINVPGVPKENVKLHLDENGRVLTVEADYKKEKEETEGKYHWKERSEGHVQRSIQLPKSCDLEKISAKQEEGVLKIKIPKHDEKVQKKTKQIKIN